jgi:prepilin-type N-terminal cleavage/methylation domain-containing protein
MFTPVSSRLRRGFTLVEIMTATAIMAVVVSFVLTILTQVMGAWNRSSDNLIIGQEAGIAMDLLTQDLQNIVLRNDGNQWLSLYTEQIDGQKQSRLQFFSPTPMRATLQANGQPIYGSVCAIEYRMMFEPLFPINTQENAKVLNLHRAVVDPISTMQGVNNSTAIMGSNSNKDTNLARMWNQYIDTGGTGNVTLGNPPQKVYGGNKPETVLISNVANFTVTVSYIEPNGQTPVGGRNAYLDGISEPWPEAFYGGTAPPGASNPVDLEAQQKVPAYFDVTLTILNDEGAQLYALNQWNNAGRTWETFLAKYGLTYTTRINVNSPPH